MRTFLLWSAQRANGDSGRLREKLGIRSGTRIAIHSEGNQLILRPINDEFIRSLRGRLKGKGSMAKARDVNTSARIELGIESYKLGIDNWSPQIKRSSAAAPAAPKHSSGNPGRW